MNNTGKMKTSEKFVVGSLVVIALVAVAFFFGFTPWKGALAQDNGGVSTNTIKELEVSAALSCPTDGDTSFTLDVANYINVTGAETFDTTAYVTDVSTGQLYTLTDTTSPSATTVNCGDKFRIEIVGTGGNDSDNGRVEKIILGGDSATLLPDGTVEFVPTQSSYALRLGLSQSGNVQFRAYDDNNKGYACNGDDACNDFELDGVTFVGTTNGTALAVGAGESINYIIEMQNTHSDGDFNDYYTLIAVEGASKATWETPSIKVNGETLSDVKGVTVTQEQLKADPGALGLTVEEGNALANYEWVFKFNKAVLDANDKAKIEFYMQAKSGQNPSTDVELDIMSGTRYLSIDGVTTKIGAYDDTTSNAVVRSPVQDVTIDIS